MTPPPADATNSLSPRYASERVAKVIEDLNLGVSVPQAEKRGGFELTAAELTEVLMRLRPLAQGQWGDPLRALIAARRAKESTEHTDAALQRSEQTSAAALATAKEALATAKEQNRLNSRMLVVSKLALGARCSPCSLLCLSRCSSSEGGSGGEAVFLLSGSAPRIVLLGESDPQAQADRRADDCGRPGVERSARARAPER